LTNFIPERKYFLSRASNLKNLLLGEKDFIGQLRAGETGAYRKLVDQFSGRVFNTALGLLQHREDAEDVSQEVFVEVFRSISLFREEAKLSSWIYRITVTKSLELLRNRKRKKRSAVVLSLFGLEHQLSQSENVPFYHPGVKLENKEMSVALFSAIAKLPLNQRTAFTLHKVENLSYAEIAEAMAVSLSSVESLMFRAKQNLQKHLAVFYEQEKDHRKFL
jgi:RNA polymerase sigma factor (sigma-70 family)